MALDTYLGLVGEVGNWVGRSDMTTARVDGFIDLLESWFNKNLRVQEMETTNGTLTYSSDTITHPTDWVAWKHLHLVSGGTRYTLKPMVQESGDVFDSGATGMPMYYYVSGSATKLVPTPDSSTYTIAGTYYQKPPALGPSQSANWILTNHPDAYLFGSLAMTEGFLANDPRIGTWRQLFEEAVAGIKKTTDMQSGQAPVMRVDINVQ
jgi:hypothetical protein